MRSSHKITALEAAAFHFPTSHGVQNAGKRCALVISPPSFRMETKVLLTEQITLKGSGYMATYRSEEVMLCWGRERSVWESIRGSASIL